MPVCHVTGLPSLYWHTHLINWWNTVKCACHIKLLLTRGNRIVNAWKDVFFSDCHLHTHQILPFWSRTVWTPQPRCQNFLPHINNEWNHPQTHFILPRENSEFKNIHTHTHETVNTIISSTLGWHKKQLSFHTSYLHTQLFIGDQSWVQTLKTHTHLCRVSSHQLVSFSRPDKAAFINLLPGLRWSLLNRKQMDREGYHRFKTLGEKKRDTT